MLKGYNAIGYTEKMDFETYLRATNPADNSTLPENFGIATEEDVNNAVALAQSAFNTYKNATGEQKAIFLETIASEIMAIGDALLERAHLETGLPLARLTGERARTTGQLNLFAALLREGSWVEAVIDEALPGRQPLPRADLRKMLVPIGPVAVFGASNFPFAFSTAGGDTVSALAAGNPVIVKAHSSHLGTNELVANTILTAAKKCEMPDGIFSFVAGEGSVVGQALARHPGVKAIGFTGSFKGGMSIYKTVQTEREEPIPVYAEMSSINPVVILPGILHAEPEKLAKQIASSITLGVGQFCTNPGLLFVLNDATDKFASLLKEALEAYEPATMLNKGICRSYYEHRKTVAKSKGVNVMLLQEADGLNKGASGLLKVSAADFIADKALQTEIFGPASLIVECASAELLEEALKSLHGQLTGTVWGTEQDLREHQQAISLLQSKVGRLIFNGLPTGVEVCYAMVHGGPYPSTADARFTSVGTDAIKRFTRPLCWQDCPDDLLPPELQQANPLKIMRRVNGKYLTAS